MVQTHFRDGAVVLYKRGESNKYQARLRLAGSKWKRISTGESDLKLASQIACEKYDEIRFRVKNNLALDTRRFRDVAHLAIKELQGELEAGYGKVAYVSYIGAIKGHFIPFFDSKHIDKIDYKILKEFDIWRTKKLGRPPKRSTLNNHNAALRRVFKIALDNNWIHAFQVPELKNKGEKSKRRPYFTRSEYRQLYRFMRKWHKTGKKERTRWIRELLRDYVLILVNTGMRFGTESQNLKWKDVELFEQGGVNYLRFWVTGKTGERELIARHSVKRYLERIKNRSPDLKNRTLSDLRNVNDYVFRLIDGSQPNDLHGAFEILLKESGLHLDRHGNKRSLYSLRHTYATFQILNGIDYHRLAKNMGTSIGMLEKHYSHLTPTLAAKELAGKTRE
jgi:integrase